jgi:hypothetical protein
MQSYARAAAGAGYEPRAAYCTKDGQQSRCHGRQQIARVHLGREQIHVYDDAKSRDSEGVRTARGDGCVGNNI